VEANLAAAGEEHGGETAPNGQWDLERKERLGHRSLSLEWIRRDLALVCFFRRLAG